MKIKWKEDYSAKTQRWFGLLIGFVCGLLVLAVVEALRNKDINWPAWIQAVGSIVAIFVAIGVAASQSYVNRKSQQAEWDRRSAEINQLRLDTLRTIEKSAELSVKVFKKACVELVGVHPRTVEDISERISRWRPSLEIANEVLMKLPVHDFPGVLIASQTLNIRVTIENVLMALDRIHNAGDVDLDKECDYLTQREADFDRQLGVMKEFMDRYDGALGVLRSTEAVPSPLKADTPGQR